MTKNINLSFIKKIFFPSVSVKEINSGYCFSWCYAVYLCYPKLRVNLYSDVEFFHAFVKIGNLYYDSESDTGTKNWKDLKTYRRYPGYFKAEVYRFGVKEFLSRWKKLGKYPSSLDKILPLAKEAKLLKRIPVVQMV